MSGLFDKLFAENKPSKRVFGARKSSRSANVNSSGSEFVGYGAARLLSMAPGCAEDQEMLESLFRRALSVSKNYLGKPVSPFSTGPRQLYTYVTMLFEDIIPSERLRIEEGFKEEEKGPTALLKVTVRDANISQSKHKDLSQVFCRLWITPDVVEVTTIRPNCDLLWWDECFVLDIHDSQKDGLHIDMWSDNPPGVGGFLCKLISQPKRSKGPNDITAPSGKHFIGEAVVPISNIPSDGGDVCVQLRKVQRSKVLGQIKISFEFGSKPCDDHVLCVAMHLLLMKKCFEKQLDSIKSSQLWKNWLHVLPNPGLTLIHQHALQNGLNMAEQTLCSWLVISSLKMKNESRISFFFLHSVLDDLNKFIAEYPLDQNFENAFQRSKERFYEYLCTILKKFHRHFSTVDAAVRNEISEMLRCLAEVDDSKTNYYSRSMKIIEEESYSFYLSVIRENRAMLEDHNPTEEICEAIKQIMKHVTVDQVTLDSVFSRAWFKNYTQITHTQLDSAISSIIKPIIQHLSSKVQSTKNQKKRFEEVKKMLHVYFSIRDLVDYIICELPEPRDRLTIEQFSSWFGEEMIIEWFRVASDISHQFIIKAVKADTLEPVSSEIKCGTSVADVIQVINQLVMKLWMKLEWEDQFYTHTALLEALKACAATYVEAVSEKTEPKRFTCGKTHFVITQQQCVTLSNIYAVFEHLQVVESEVKDIIKRAEEDFSIAILDPLDIDQDELLCNVAAVFGEFFSKVSRRLSDLSTRVIKSKAGSNQDEAVYKLYKFVDTSLQIMSRNLTPNLFNLMLREMWAVAVMNLHSNFKHSEAAVNGIYQAMNLLQSVFHGEDFGLSWYEMQNKKFVELMEYVMAGRNLRMTSPLGGPFS